MNGVVYNARTVYFNPRTYVRCDLVQVSELPTIIYFNPRTYVRCDIIRIYHYVVTSISIHAPT